MTLFETISSDERKKIGDCASELWNDLTNMIFE